LRRRIIIIYTYYIMDRPEIQENLYKLHEVAVLYRRRLERANEPRIEYTKKELKSVEAEIEKLHVIWDNFED
jgi:hypothetical protein